MFSKTFAESAVMHAEQNEPHIQQPQSVSDGPALPLDIIGWREWLGLPDLGIRRIKVKIDTGAKSSAIHAYNIRVFARGGTEIVSFDIHPRQNNDRVVVSSEAEVLEFRKVRNSGGAVDTRPVIVTHAVLFGRRFPIELTLANRDEMGYRMLLGREAMRGRFLVNANESYLGERWPLGRTGPFTSPYVANAQRLGNYKSLANETPAIETASLDVQDSHPPLPRERGRG